MPRILIVDDEPEMVRGLEDNLRFEGYQTLSATDGRRGLALALSEAPDLAPARHHDAGHERLGRVPRAARQGPRHPGHHADGARRGGRPGPGARVGRRRLRHQAVRPARAPGAGFAPCCGGPGRGRSSRSSPSATCGFACAAARLSARGGRSGSPARSSTSCATWSSIAARSSRAIVCSTRSGATSSFPTTRTVDTHILRLRQKFEDDPERPVYILTVHGQGYRFAG